MQSTFRNLRPLASGILGIGFMLPATYFLFTIFGRVLFKAKAPYYEISPSFLQSPFNPFALHKAQLILGFLMLAVLFNVAAVLRLRLHQRPNGLEVGVAYRRYWLNTAVALQSFLLLAILSLYTVIQHLRY